MKSSCKLVQTIKAFEGFKAKAYKCSAGVWTIGYGHTDCVCKGDTCTEAQAEQWLISDLGKAEVVVNAQGLELTQNRFDALVSFMYNVGARNFLNSTLLRKIKSDPAEPTIADEFMRWIYAGGKKLKGLENRRRREVAMYFKGEYL